MKVSKSVIISEKQLNNILKDYIFKKKVMEKPSEVSFELVNGGAVTKPCITGIKVSWVED